MIAFIIGLLVGAGGGGTLVYMKYGKITATTTAVATAVDEVKKA